MVVLVRNSVLYIFFFFSFARKLQLFYMFLYRIFIADIPYIIQTIFINLKHKPNCISLLFYCNIKLFALINIKLRSTLLLSP